MNDILLSVFDSPTLGSRPPLQFGSILRPEVSESTMKTVKEHVSRLLERFPLYTASQYSDMMNTVESQAAEIQILRDQIQVLKDELAARVGAETRDPEQAYFWSEEWQAEERGVDNVMSDEELADVFGMDVGELPNSEFVPKQGIIPMDEKFDEADF